MTLNDVVITDVNSRPGPRLSFGSGAPGDSISLISEALPKPMWLGRFCVCSKSSRQEQEDHESDMNSGLRKGAPLLPPELHTSENFLHGSQSDTSRTGH